MLRHEVACSAPGEQTMSALGRLALFAALTPLLSKACQLHRFVSPEALLRWNRGLVKRRWIRLRGRSPSRSTVPQLRRLVLRLSSEFDLGMPPMLHRRFVSRLPLTNSLRQSEPRDSKPLTATAIRQRNKAK